MMPNGEHVAQPVRISRDEKHLATPEAMASRVAMPKVHGKQSEVRGPRSAKMAMPFFEEMSEEAMHDFHQRLESEFLSQDAAAAARSA